jgi:hypothetical protein
MYQHFYLPRFLAAKDKENSLKNPKSLEMNGNPWPNPSNVTPDAEVTVYGSSKMSADLNR